MFRARRESRIELADKGTIARAADILARGGLVAFPTETVYGLGANAADDDAVARIFEAKKRPRFNPLIVHVRDVEHARALGEFLPLSQALAEAFWPGPLTLVVPRQPGCGVSLLASAGLQTIALRAPAHPAARQLLRSSGLAIAAPSANVSGAVSPTCATHVAEGLSEAVELILDAGPAEFGLESTIIGADERGAVLLRPGALPREDIEEICGSLREGGGGAISSPGRLASHYAPATPLRLDACTVGVHEALLAFGPEPGDGPVVRNLSVSGNLREAAANLFAMLRELDAAGCSCIAVAPIPEHGLGEAINDRLRRAAAPRLP